MRLEGRDVSIEAVKLADDGSGDLVLRVYERSAGRSKARLVAGFPIDHAWTCDLHEEADGQDLEVLGDGIELALRAFQVLTVRFRPAGDVPAPDSSQV